MKTSHSSSLRRDVQMEYHKHFSLTHITYPHNDHLASILALLSLTPPFAVCALSSSIIIYKDVIAAYLLLGLILTAAVCSVLKEIIKEPRPDRNDGCHNNSIESEYGMPSNHSAFAWFGATFIIMYIWRGYKLPSRGWIISQSNINGNTHTRPMFREGKLTVLIKIWKYLHTQVTILSVLGIAFGCAYSRVYLGYHTANQVVVGSIIGVCLGTGWHRLFETALVRNSLEWFDWSVVEIERRKCLRFECGENAKDD
eukprot:scaffold12278_cov69-Cyclotella_meneghiniana.AAC.3